MSACVCVCMSAPFFFDFVPSVHPSTKGMERAGKDRKEAERGRKGRTKILHLLPMLVAIFRYGRASSALQFWYI